MGGTTPDDAAARADPAAFAAFAEPLRLEVYRLLVAASGPLTREEVAEGVGIGRPLAAFHLEKLVGLGLVEVAEPARQEGPGRPAKRYRASQGEVLLAVPPRNYRLAATVLAAAAAKAGKGMAGVVAAAARDTGAGIGGRARRDAGAGATREKLMAAARRALEALGYAPHRSAGGSLELANCPFASLRSTERATVCQMNYELLSGFSAALGAPGVAARLDPQPGRCCVTLVAGVAPAGSSPG